MAFVDSLIIKFLTLTSGYKSILAFVGYICYGVYLLFAKNGGAPPVAADVDAAIQAFLTGLSVLGIAHKIAKLNPNQPPGKP